MMCESKASQGIVGSVSKQAGTFAGTSVVVSRKLANYGVKSATSVSHWLKKSFHGLPSPSNKASTSTVSGRCSSEMQETERKKAAKALIATLESALAAGRGQLKEPQSVSEKSEAEHARQPSRRAKDNESSIADSVQYEAKANRDLSGEVEVTAQMTAPKSDLPAEANQEKASVNEEKETESEVPASLAAMQKEVPGRSSKTVAEEAARIPDEKGPEFVTETPPAESEREARVSEERSSQGPHEALATYLPGMAADEVQAATFPNMADRIIFSRALSDMASNDAAVRADAVRTIAGIRHELSLKAIVAHMASEPSAQVRRHCVKALASLEMKEALPAVEYALGDPAGSVRLAGVWALYRLLGAESGPKLMGMFFDEDEEVRRRAATCIGWLGHPDFAVELLPLLDDESVPVRRASVEAMASLGNQHVVSSLIEHLNDPVESVRSSVLGAIETITGRKMTKSAPKDEVEFQRVIVRWREWWKEELLT